MAQRKKKPKRGREKKTQAPDRTPEYRNLVRVLRENWSKHREATRGQTAVYPRALWRGMPSEDANDPLCLSGMEFVVLWYENEADRDHWQNGLEVSIIAIHDWYDTSDEVERGLCHRYRGNVIQLAESSYADLLAQQRIRGRVKEDEHFGTATQRDVLIAMNVASPIKLEKQLLRQRSAMIPELMLLGAAVPCVLPPTQDTRAFNDQISEDTLMNDLSDLEVDRVWEFSNALREWLINRRQAVERRKREKRYHQRELEALSGPLAQGMQEFEHAKAEVEATASALAATQQLVSTAEQKLREAETRLRSEVALRRQSIRRCENEKGRLSGVKREVFAQVAAYKGASIPDTLTKKMEHLQQQEAALPGQIEADRRAIEELEERAATQHVELKRELEAAQAAYTAAEARHQEALSQCRAAESAQVQLQREQQLRLAQLEFYG